MQTEQTSKRHIKSWSDIEWAKVEADVRRLQGRIYRAAATGQRAKVKNLQKLLVRSHCAKLLAIRQVTQRNQGRQTPGVDGVICVTPESRVELLRSGLPFKGYRPMSVRRVYIPKSNGTKRPLGIPTIRDRVMQALVKLALEAEWESRFEANSYGFRPGRCTIDAATAAYKVLVQTAGGWVLDADIAGCFDNISHEALLARLPVFTMTIRRWLKAGVVELGTWKATDTGTPQGGIISPLLANIALDGMERLFDAEKRDGRPKRPCFRRGPNRGVSLIRYADDFIVTAPTRECLEGYVKPKLEAFLAMRGLAFSEAKTHVVNVDDGFDFLGFTIRKLSGKLLTRPQKEKMLAYLRGIGEFLRENRQAPTAVVIKQLIPVIRGWSAYYRHGASSRAFSYADYRLWMMLWSWAKRRHPTKSLVWVKRRYFARARGRDWTFYWGTSGKTGMTLPRHCDMPFIRHIKVAGRNSPLNPDLRAYWDARRAVRLAKESYSKRRKQLLKLQGHVCAECGVPFDPDDDKELMQVQCFKPRCKAGDDADGSPLLVHRWCHHQHQRSGNHAAEA